MSHLHTLLATTDLSAPARHAAKRAALLAQQLGARLELVHVLEKTAFDDLQKLFGTESEALESRIREQARDALSQLAADIGEPYGISPGCHLPEGPILENIIDQADRFDASLLVMGVRGSSFMRHWLLGATVERLMRKTVHPILVVKQPPHEPYRRVIVPIDFSPWTIGALRMARAVAPHAELILLNAYEVPFEGKMRFAGVEEKSIRRHRETTQKQALAQLYEAAIEAQLGDAWRPVVAHGEAASRILEQEEEQGTDLIVLGKHGTGMDEELLLGSVTKHVLAHARSDVLVASR